MPVRSELIAHVLPQQATGPQLVLLIATTIVYRRDPSGFSRNVPFSPLSLLAVPVVRSEREVPR